ncbi:MAG: tetratricopeptide repeat protein [Myxococcota bacterium]
MGRATHLLLAAALGCAAAGPASEGATRADVALGFEAPSTEGRIALANLDGEIAVLEAQLAGPGARDALRLRTIDALLLRQQVRADARDLGRALVLAEAVEGTGRSVAEGRVRDVRHEWDAALALLPPGSREAETIALARGADPAAILALRDDRAAASPGFATELDLAAALNAAGRYDEADAAYQRALAAYGGVSPFPVAFVQFARGVMWAERAGRPELARPLYEEAVRRSPAYVVANVHLAELEAEAGETDAAIARLERIAAESPDPEAPGLLGELLAERNPERAATLVARARGTYEALLDVHRLAYVDHATEFFLGPGDDAARALGLAEENLANRDTERARDLAIRAAEAAGELARACDLAKPFDARPVLTEPLAETLEALDARCP